MGFYKSFKNNSSPSSSEKKKQELEYQEFQYENEFYLEPEPEPISECSICIEEIINKNDEVITGCNHHFHSHCLHHWTMQNNSCPNCRTPQAAVCNIGYSNLIIDIPESPASLIRNSPFYHILEHEITPSSYSSSHRNSNVNNSNLNTELDNYINNVYNNVNNINNINNILDQDIIRTNIDDLENLDTQLRHYQGIVHAIRT